MPAQGVAINIYSALAVSIKHAGGHAGQLAEATVTSSLSMPAFINPQLIVNELSVSYAVISILGCFLETRSRDAVSAADAANIHSLLFWWLIQPY